MSRRKYILIGLGTLAVVGAAHQSTTTHSAPSVTVVVQVPVAPRSVAPSVAVSPHSVTVVAPRSAKVTCPTTHPASGNISYATGDWDVPVSVHDSHGSWMQCISRLAILSCDSTRTTCRVQDLVSRRVGSASGDSLLAN